MINSEKKFIVWDWNGTMIDDLALNVACFNKTLALAGKPGIDAIRYRETFEIPVKNFYCRNGYSEIEFDEAKHALQAVFHDHYNLGIEIIGFRAGAREIVQATHAHNIRHIILSNHLVSAIDRHLAILEARHFFWDILAHESHEAQANWMPKGNRLTGFMESHGLRPENGIIVGDTPEETHIARQSGLTSIAITGGFASDERLRDAVPDHLVGNLHDMNPILRARGFMP